MAFQSDPGDETNLHLFFGRCLLKKVAIGQQSSRAVRLHDYAVETERMAFDSVHVEAQ